MNVRRHPSLKLSSHLPDLNSALVNLSDGIPFLNLLIAPLHVRFELNLSTILNFPPISEQDFAQITSVVLPLLGVRGDGAVSDRPMDGRRWAAAKFGLRNCSDARRLSVAGDCRRVGALRRREVHDLQQEQFAGHHQ